MDITPYHWYFALFFVIAFSVGLTWAYRNDLKRIGKSYGRVRTVFLVVFGGLLVLLLVKFLTRNL
jgi:threonine/homoserine/homoserine lactone efflux protein